MTQLEAEQAAIVQRMQQENEQLREHLDICIRTLWYYAGADQVTMAWALDTGEEKMSEDWGMTAYLTLELLGIKGASTVLDTLPRAKAAKTAKTTGIQKACEIQRLVKCLETITKPQPKLRDLKVGKEVVHD